jgi:hypothetical protein
MGLCYTCVDQSTVEVIEQVRQASLTTPARRQACGMCMRVRRPLRLLPGERQSSAPAPDACCCAQCGRFNRFAEPGFNCIWCCVGAKPWHGPTARRRCQPAQVPRAGLQASVCCISYTAGCAGAQARQWRAACRCAYSSWMSAAKQKHSTTFAALAAPASVSLRRKWLGKTLTHCVPGQVFVNVVVSVQYQVGGRSRVPGLGGAGIGASTCVTSCSGFAHRSLCAVLQVKDNESLYPAFYKLTDSRSQITSCAPPASRMEPALSGVRMPPFLQPSVRWRLPHEVHMLQTSLTWCAQPCRRSCWTTSSRCAARARWSRQQRLCSIKLACSHPCIPVHVIQVKQLVTGAM